MRRQRPPSPLEEALAYLRDALQDGPTPAQALIEGAMAVGINRTILIQAKHALGVRATVQGGQEVWS